MELRQSDNYLKEDESLRIARILLDAGADVGAKDEKGNSAADYARRLFHYGMLRLLEQWGAKMPEDTKSEPGSV